MAFITFFKCCFSLGNLGQWWGPEIWPIRSEKEPPSESPIPTGSHCRPGQESLLPPSHHSFTTRGKLGTELSERAKVTDSSLPHLLRKALGDN